VGVRGLGHAFPDLPLRPPTTVTYHPLRTQTLWWPRRSTRTVGFVKIQRIEPMSALVGIYNADSGIVGELTYLFNKVLRNTHCHLCDLTHGWNPNGRRSWKEACGTSSLNISFIHRNEATDAQLAAAELLPTIVALNNGEWACVVTAAELAEHSDDPDWVIRQAGLR